MTPDELPPRRAKADTPSAELKAANDGGRMGTTTIDPRIVVVARALGRQMAREHLRDWQATNDNVREDAS
jgi:hypothetical protein